MRYRTAISAGVAAGAFALATLLSGCALWGKASEGPNTKNMPEVPLKIISEGQLPASDGPSEGLMSQLKKQLDAVNARNAAGKDVAEAAPEVESSAARIESTETVELATTERATAPAAQELTVKYLLGELEQKENRSPGEEEAYKRLLGASQSVSAPPADGADEYNLLGEARDALLKSEFDVARAKASQALMLIRRKADPVIERVCFATDVRNYGDADVVSPAEFAAGQKVLAVTDLSDFACLPVEKSSPAEIYYTKMAQRLVIYDSNGKLYWQNAYGAFEYQSSHYVSTMFIPRIFDLPRDLPSGQYVLKVEISDELAGRQAESSVQFTVK